MTEKGQKNFKLHKIGIHTAISFIKAFVVLPNKTSTFYNNGHFLHRTHPSQKINKPHLSDKVILAKKIDVRYHCPGFWLEREVWGKFCSAQVELVVFCNLKKVSNKQRIFWGKLTLPTKRKSFLQFWDHSVLNLSKVNLSFPFMALNKVMNVCLQMFYKKKKSGKCKCICIYIV